MTEAPPFAQAIDHHRHGRLAEAEALYRHVLGLEPAHADAHHNLGMIALQTGQAELGLPHLRAALELVPDNPQYRLTLAEALLAADRVEEAWEWVGVERAAGRSDPDFLEFANRCGLALAGGLFNQGNTLREAGQMSAAVDYYRAALEVAPDFVRALNNLGGTLVAMGRAREGAEAFERLSALRPEDPKAKANLALARRREGLALLERGQAEEAAHWLHRSLDIRPDDAPTLVNLCNALLERRLFPEAQEAARAALALEPNMFEAHLALANVSQLAGDLDGAIHHYRRSLEIHPDSTAARGNLGSLLLLMGRSREAMEAYEQALAIDPLDIQAHRNLLLALLYDDRWTPDERLAFHARFEERMAKPLYPDNPAFLCPLDSGAKLRIGYVSSDFRAHPVGRNLLPILRRHDRSRVEVHLYAEVRQPDFLTDAFKDLADGWHSIIGLDDGAAAELIRSHGIHVLINLAGRFDGNHPLICAHRPAPVMLGFHDAATTGLSVMDGILTDRVMTPTGGSERFAERPIRLPSLYLHPPIAKSPDSGPLPMLAGGGPVFASFNNPAKLSDQTLALWARVLKRVPGSRLRLKYKRLFTQAPLAARVRDAMAAQGVGPERLILAGEDEGVNEHLALYRQVDIALDPFPFTGSTTTFEALWMGVPVVTLAGGTMVGRWSTAMLTSLGLTDLIAATAEDYIEICAALAGDPQRLAGLRAQLRQRVEASSLCDARGKTRHIERICRALWRRWTARSSRTRAYALLGEGRLAEALPFLEAALAADPRNPSLLADQGVVLNLLGRFEEAVAALKASLAIAPDRPKTVANLAAVWSNFGNALKGAGQESGAEACYRNALEVLPDFEDGLFNLGVTLSDSGRHEEALELYRRVLRLNPDHLQAALNGGAVLVELSRFEDAKAELEELVRRRPDSAEAALNLGNVWRGLGELDQAVACYRRAASLCPDLAQAANNLGSMLQVLGRFDEASDCYRRILAGEDGEVVEPSALPEMFARAQSRSTGSIARNQDLSVLLGAANNLGTMLQNLGRFDDAVACYRAALEVDPTNVLVHRNILVALLYSARWTEEERFAEHRRFEAMHAVRHYPANPVFKNSRDPNRKMRVGFLSSDLREHPVARNLLPVLRGFDPRRVEMYFYAELKAPDSVTEVFQAAAAGWRLTAGLDDSRVAEMIRADEIDVLVCLAGRFDDNRPLVCAHRPAPVQVSWYDAATSGMTVMDAILTDRVMTPRNGSEKFTERPIRLPTFYVHDPMDGAPDVVPPPCLSGAPPVFASFSNPCKLDDATLALWARVIKRVPGSKLWLKYKNLFASPPLARRVLAVMEANGVEPDRVILGGKADDAQAHLALYGGVDIALDSFPFNGSTTTFEALWMGVPVVTLLGTNLMGRWTAAMLRAIKLSDLVAETPEDFVDICERLAADRDRLASLRSGMRQAVAASPLCDSRARGRQVERVCRALWRRWLARAKSH